MNHKSLVIGGLTVISILLLLSFSTSKKSAKYYSADKQYSIYARPYLYAELSCVYSFMDCAKKGKIYLYDEIEKKIIGTGFTNNTDNISSINLSYS